MNKTTFEILIFNKEKRVEVECELCKEKITIIFIKNINWNNVEIRERAEFKYMVHYNFCESNDERKHLTTFIINKKVTEPYATWRKIQERFYN